LDRDNRTSATDQRADIGTRKQSAHCKTEGEVRSFFGVGGNLEQRPKAISPRILALIKGGSAEPRPESGVVNTLKESARSAPTKAAPQGKDKATGDRKAERKADPSYEEEI